MAEDYVLPPLPRRTRRGRARSSYAFGVVLPTVLVGIYFGVFARPRYISEFHFSIYQPSGGGTQGSGSATAGVPTGGDLPSAVPSVANYVVADYLTSTQVIRDLQARLDLRSILDDSAGDLFGRYWWGDSSPERMIWYWNNFTTDVNYDVTSGLTTVAVTTYSAKNSLKIAEALRRLSEQVVNNMSTTARADKVRFAEAALRRVDTRLKDVLSREQALRNEQKTPDPASAAQAMLSYTGSLRQSVDALRSEDEVLSHSLGPKAPARQILERQIAATEAQLRKAQSEMGVDSAPDERLGAKLPRQLNAFEYLELERSFLATYDNSLMQFLEEARMDDATQHNYVEAYVLPYEAHHARLPRPLTWTFLTFIVLSTVWLIGLLAYLSIRDHLPPADADEAL